MNTLVKIFAFVLFCFMIVGCAWNRTYEFTVINTTDYKIDTLKIGCGLEGKKKISVNPNDTTEQFEIRFRYLIPLTEPLLCLTVTNYSDSTGNYENTYGGVISESSLTGIRSNILKIKLDKYSMYDGDIFLIKLQEYTPLY